MTLELWKSTDPRLEMLLSLWQVSHWLVSVSVWIRFELVLILTGEPQLALPVYVALLWQVMQVEVLIGPKCWYGEVDRLVMSFI